MNEAQESPQSQELLVCMATLKKLFSKTAEYPENHRSKSIDKLFWFLAAFIATQQQNRQQQDLDAKNQSPHAAFLMRKIISLRPQLPGQFTHLGRFHFREQFILNLHERRLSSGNTEFHLKITPHGQPRFDLIDATVTMISTQPSTNHQHHTILGSMLNSVTLYDASSGKKTVLYNWPTSS